MRVAATRQFAHIADLTEQPAFKNGNPDPSHLPE